MNENLARPESLVNFLINQMYDASYLSSLVNRQVQLGDPEGHGRSASIRVPRKYSVKEFDRGVDGEGEVEVQDVGVDTISVALQKIPDFTFAVTAEEVTADIDNWAGLILAPIGQAMAEYFDVQLLNTMLTANTKVVEDDPNDPRVGIVAARQAIHAAPQIGRSLLAGSKLHARLELDKQISSQNTAGTVEGGDALRNARLAKLSTFDIYEQFRLDGKLAGGKEVLGFGFQTDAFALVTKQLVSPTNQELPNISELISARDGFEVTVTGDGELSGLGVRLTGWYEGRKKKYYMSIDSWMGTAVFDANKAVKIVAGSGAGGGGGTGGNTVTVTPGS